MLSGGVSGGWSALFWMFTYTLLYTALIVSVTVLTIAFIAFFGVIVAAVSSFIAETLLLFSNLVMLAGIKLGAVPSIMALFETVLFYNAISPLTGWPDPVSIALCVMMYFRIFLLNQFLKIVFIVSPNIYWVLMPHINKLRLKAG